jgi:hypothetical protein
MKEYRVEAIGKRLTSGQTERFLIITTSRDRALHFAGIFRANQEYETVSVEVQGVVWIGGRIGEIP